MTGAHTSLPLFMPMLVSTDQRNVGGQEVAVEPKWDGARCVVYVEGDTTRLLSRRGRDITAHAPELQPLARTLAHRSVVIDGELVAVDRAGRPDFYGVARRLTISRPQALAWARHQQPLTFVAFDVLWLDGRSLLAAPYEHRRAVLSSLAVRGPAWQTTPSYVVDDIDDVLAACDSLGLEGIVTKALSSTYRPGQRSRHWVKTKTAAWRSTHESRRRPHFARVQRKHDQPSPRTHSTTP